MFHSAGLYDNRMITDEELEKLKVLEPVLVDILDTSVVNALLKTGCISAGHVQAIMKQTSDRRKNGELLNIMKHRSFAQYKQFIQCLHETHQTQVIHLLASYKRNVICINIPLTIEKHLKSD